MQRTVHIIIHTGKSSRRSKACPTALAAQKIALLKRGKRLVRLAYAPVCDRCFSEREREKWKGVGEVGRGSSLQPSLALALTPEDVVC